MPADRNGDRRITLCGQELPHPGHVCAFFESQEQKYDTIVPFFLDAVAVGDRIINVVDGEQRDAHLQRLRARDARLGQAVESEQLRVLTSEETYLRPGLQDLDGMLELVHDALQEAEAEQRCVRTCGEMSWVARSTLPVERVLEYEARVNHFVPTFTCTLLCAYDVAAIPSGLLSEILATHPFAIIKGRLRPNPYYVEPEENV
jgi:hypothetical protein